MLWGDVMRDTKNVWFVVWGDESDRRLDGRIGAKARSASGIRTGDGVKSAMRFARAMVRGDHVMPVLLEQNRPWWEPALDGVPKDNVMEQPLDRGSAPGILAAALRASRRDPDAILVLLRVDGQEPRRSAVFRAVEVARREDAVVLVPRASSEVAATVSPKEGLPELEEAALAVARASALLAFFRRCCPDLVAEMEQAGPVDEPSTFDLVFPFLPDTDFLEHVLEPSPCLVLG